MSMPTDLPSEIGSSVVTTDHSPTAPFSADDIGGVVVLDQGCKKFAHFCSCNVTW